MSYDVQDLIYEIDLKPGLKHMLLTLATWASHDGTNIFPGKSAIMRRSSYSMKQIKRNMKALIRLGYLIYVGKEPKHGTNIYNINMDKLSPEQVNNGQNVSESGQIVTPEMDNMSKKTDNMSKKMDIMTPKSVINPNQSSSNNQSLNPQATNNPDDDEDFLNLMESDVGQLFLKAYERVPKLSEMPQLNQMLDQSHGPAKLTAILNRAIEKSLKPKVVKYLVSAFNDEPTPPPIQSDPITYSGWSNDDLPSYEQVLKERQVEETRIKALLEVKFPVDEQWESAKKGMQKTMDRANFDTWIAPTRFLEKDDDKFVIATSNSFLCDHLQYRLYDKVQPHLAEVIGKDIKIEFRVCIGMPK